MPKPHQRSRHIIRKRKRLPGGRRTTHYRRRRNDRPICANCGTKLLGVSASPTKTMKRPQRPYGGVLCFNCLQQMMVEKARTI